MAYGKRRQHERNQPSKTTLAQFQRRTTPHPHTALAAPAPELAPVAVPSSLVVPSIPPTSVPPVPLEPRRSVDLRPTGTIAQNAAGEPYVLGPDGRRFVLDKESASSAILRALLDRLRASEQPQVRFVPERIKMNGKHTNVARTVEPVEESQR